MSATGQLRKRSPSGSGAYPAAPGRPEDIVAGPPLSAIAGEEP